MFFFKCVRLVQRLSFFNIEGESCVVCAIIILLHDKKINMLTFDENDCSVQKEVLALLSLAVKNWFVTVYLFHAQIK